MRSGSREMLAVGTRPKQGLHFQKIHSCPRRRFPAQNLILVKKVLKLLCEFLLLNSSYRQLSTPFLFEIEIVNFNFFVVHLWMTSHKLGSLFCSMETGFIQTSLIMLPHKSSPSCMMSFSIVPHLLKNLQQKARLSYFVQQFLMAFLFLYCILLRL